MQPGHATPDGKALGPGDHLTGAHATGAELRRLFGALATRFADAAERCRRDDDGEAVHDLRVASRRLESALQLWRAALDRDARRAVRRRLRRWRRRLSPVRSLEVFAAALESPDLAPPESAAVLAALSTATRARAERARRREAARMAPRRIARLCASVRGVVLAEPGDVPGREATLAALRRFGRCERQAMLALAQAHGSEADEVLHAARIAVKKLRYAEESLAAVTGAPLSASVARARALQQALGTVHDHAELRDRLLAHARRACERNRPEPAAALTAAAAQAERMRHEAIEAFRRKLAPSLSAAG